jgi:hypothetical protein
MQHMMPPWCVHANGDVQNMWQQMLLGILLLLKLMMVIMTVNLINVCLALTT